MKKKYLKDYKKSLFNIIHTELYFKVFEESIMVSSILNIIKLSDYVMDLSLDGEELNLRYIKVNNNFLKKDDFILTNNKLIIKNIKQKKNKIEILCIIYQRKNTLLSGIYKSGSHIYSQCEPEGFRRITYFIDRPDILSTYKVIISADYNIFPYMLSNGKVIDYYKDIKNNRHTIIWEDNIKKSCYLFALVLGNFDVLYDTYTTKSNNKVSLEVYTKKYEEQESNIAMNALKKAMLWEEKNYNLEYDLKKYMMVAAQDFNSGAMENKGLNIFNEKYILINPKYSLDTDYLNVYAVIAHEYFHNWSGNRITCRDWFQITLKEGYTVFREQNFMSSFFNKDYQRIEDAYTIRTHQFLEDSSSISHPIYPESYIKINNFYTTTVYEKGAEVIRMLQTVLGKETFKKGEELYFKKYDNQAITIDEFFDSITYFCNNPNIKQFKNWYYNSGTPEVIINMNFIKEKKLIHISMEQKNFKNYKNNDPLYIPIKIALINEKFEIKEYLLHFNKIKENFYFQYENSNKPLLSINRDFSAPIYIKYHYSIKDLLIIWKKDNNIYSRYDASKSIIENEIINFIKNDKFNNIQYISDAIKDILLYEDDLMIKNLLVYLGDYNSIYTALINKKIIIDPIKLYYSIKYFIKNISCKIQDILYDQYKKYLNIKNDFSKYSIIKRMIKNKILFYLSYSNKKEYQQLSYNQYYNCNNITEKLGAISAAFIIQDNIKNNNYLLNDFFKRYKKNNLLLDKWFYLKALNSVNIQEIKDLLNNKYFSYNPNRILSIASGLKNNILLFHSSNGYEFLSNLIIKIDKINKILSSKIAQFFSIKKYFCIQYRKNMELEIEKIKNNNISSNLYEVLSKE